MLCIYQNHTLLNFRHFVVDFMGVVTALKPVRVERVTNKLRDPTNPHLTLTEKNWPSEIE